MKFLAPLLLLVLAAVLEVSGDAAVRHGLRSERLWLLAGSAILFGYGLVVNAPKWDFGRLLGVYIAVFFVVSQVVAGLAFGEKPTSATWLGGAFIVAGGAVIAAGKR